MKIEQAGTHEDADPRAEAKVSFVRNDLANADARPQLSRVASSEAASKEGGSGVGR